MSRETHRKETNEKPLFSPQRYPSLFSIDVRSRNNEDIPMVSLPIGGERTIKFSTDVEDQYFDRVSDPGELQIGLLDLAPNEQKGGDRPGLPKKVDAILNVTKSSPHDGTIRVLVKPTQEVKVGDAIKLRASLSSPGKELDQIFMVKIAAPEKKDKDPKKGDQPDSRLGLPKLQMVYEKSHQDHTTWEKLEEQGIEMNHEVVVHPLVDGESLGAVYINMDSNAWLSHRANLATEEAITVAERRYVSAVYFHTLFLYTITKNRKYSIKGEREPEGECSVEITEYIADLFKTFYAQFLLNFDTKELVAALDA